MGKKKMEEIRQLDAARSRKRRRIGVRQIFYSYIAPINTADGEVALDAIYHGRSYEAAHYNPCAGREKKNIAYRYVWKPSGVKNKKSRKKKRSFPSELNVISWAVSRYFLFFWRYITMLRILRSRHLGDIKSRALPTLI